MKKIFKILVIVFIICFVIFIINCLRNYTIIKKIQEQGNRIFSSNYHITCTITKPYQENYNYKTEIYYKDNICKIDSYNNNILETISWKNFLTQESISNIITSDEVIKDNSFNEELLKSLKGAYFLEEISNINLLKKCAFLIIKSEDSFYIINNGEHNSTYYDKSNGLLIKNQTIIEDEEFKDLSNVITYNAELDCVSDDEISKDNIIEY